MSDIRLVIFDWVIGQMQFKGMVKPLYAVQSSSINDGQNFLLNVTIQCVSMGVVVVGQSLCTHGKINIP